MPRTAKGTRHVNCVDCGRPQVRHAGDDRPCCIECAAQRMVTHTQAMRDKRGPTYERTVVGQLRHWQAEAERLGLADRGGDRPDTPTGVSVVARA